MREELPQLKALEIPHATIYNRLNINGLLEHWKKEARRG
jgi:hypothetical protein